MSNNKYLSLLEQVLRLRKHKTHVFIVYFANPSPFIQVLSAVPWLQMVHESGPFRLQIKGKQIPYSVETEQQRIAFLTDLHHFFHLFTNEKVFATPNEEETLQCVGKQVFFYENLAEQLLRVTNHATTTRNNFGLAWPCTLRLLCPNYFEQTRGASIDSRNRRRNPICRIHTQFSLCILIFI